MIVNSTGMNAHPGWNLSRACIRDTLLAKRTGVFKAGGQIAAAICQHNLRMLRETRLAPHREAKLISNRYWVRQAIKKHNPYECKCCSNAFDSAEYIRRADNSRVLALCKEDAFLCITCLKTILCEVQYAPNDCCIVFISGGIVHKIVLPEKTNNQLCCCRP